MKFLIALSVLASSSVFAFDLEDRYIKCYEPAQQGDGAELVYKLAAKDGHLYMVYPFHAKMKLNNDHCLETYYHNSDESFEYDENRRLELCRGEGQHINRLIPIDVHEYNQEEETVYCDKEIKRWFHRNS